MPDAALATPGRDAGTAGQDARCAQGTDVWLVQDADT